MSKPRRPRRAVSGILLLDKPTGMSSNAALQTVRRLYQADKAGHTGSLDPMATGMLPICLGEATKLSGVLLDADKSYRAEVVLGARTDTGDADGEVIETAPGGIARADLEAVLPRFRGRIEQVPPMYSALKHQGQRLYALAREGREVERPARPVTIHELELERFDEGGVTLFVRCSKGTYIRSLAEDLARAAGTLAHLGGLRRTAVSPFDGRPMLSLAELETLAGSGMAALDAMLLSPAEGLVHWRRITVGAEQARDLAQGRAIEAPPGLDAGPRLAVLDDAGTLLGLAEVSAEHRIQPRRWLHTASHASECL